MSRNPNEYQIMHFGWLCEQAIALTRIQKFDARHAKRIQEWKGKTAKELEQQSRIFGYTTNLQHGLSLGQEVKTLRAMYAKVDADTWSALKPIRCKIVVCGHSLSTFFISANVSCLGVCHTHFPQSV